VNKLIFFSKNLNKIYEVKNILEKSKFKILTLNDLPKIKGPKEVGDTFEKNAIIKSCFGFEKFGLPCFADDSGICISALDNKPGIYSKRFQKENGGIKKTLQKIINETKRKKNFNAFFHTTISFTIKKNISICFKGTVKGKISTQPLGSFGFHYDPIFIPRGQTKTYAQMFSNEKNLLSHRAVALKKFVRFIERSFN